MHMVSQKTEFHMERNKGHPKGNKLRLSSLSLPEQGHQPPSHACGRDAKKDRQSRGKALQ